MRIISGRLGGRQFNAPPGHRTHPMSDKMRGALFNMLGDIDGLTVLDAFAGSGALSFEAISRGSGAVIAIETDKTAQSTIQENIQTLGLTERVKVIRANASGWSDNNADKQFDLVLLDPPYDHLQPTVLKKLMHHVKPGGLAVLSYPPGIKPDYSGMELLQRRSYGDSQLLFYRKIS